MANKPSESLEQRVQKAMLQHAFFRWESAVIIGLTLTLMVFGPEVTQISALAWLLGGLAAEAGLVWSSFSDPETGRKVVAQLLEDEFEPKRLSDPKLQQQVQEALDYRSRITAAIRERRDSVLKDSLTETASEIDQWIESIYGLAQRLDRYQRERKVLERDWLRAQERPEQLRSQLRQEDDPSVRQDIEATIANLERQRETIETLDNTMERAKLQLENTMASLGTVYSQTMLVGAKDIDSGRAKRLRQDIAEEVQELDNILVSMDEVYASSGQA